MPALYGARPSLKMMRASAVTKSPTCRRFMRVAIGRRADSASRSGDSASRSVPSSTKQDNSPLRRVRVRLRDRVRSALSSFPIAFVCPWRQPGSYSCMATPTQGVLRASLLTRTAPGFSTSTRPNNNPDHSLSAVINMSQPRSVREDLSFLLQTRGIHYTVLYTYSC